jgi:topoisomerase IA-like protein
VLGTHPSTGADIRLLRGPFGWYLELPPAQSPGPADEELPEKELPEAAGKGRGRKKKVATAKPKRVSLGKGNAPPQITLEEALELLQWPKARALACCGICMHLSSFAVTSALPSYIM